ncbi:MAG: hypothetical protein K2N43_05255, partial [Lachnospiraceae bacterium]|nr:hypothetical protein [Lachnospiraceae bacterium]
VRVRREQGKDVQELLQSCGRYIDEFVTDGEEHAKIFCKYAWLEAGQKLEQGCPGDALWLCLSALEELRKYNIEYFMRPLFHTALCCYRQLGKEAGKACEYWKGIPGGEQKGEATLISEKRCRVYLRILTHLHEKFGEPWYPSDSILYNCCQKSYHLDYEILCAERYMHGQEHTGQLKANCRSMMKIGTGAHAEEFNRGGICQGNIQRTCVQLGSTRRECVPNDRYFAYEIGRSGLEKEQRSSYIITDSFETLELRKDIQRYVSRKQYDKVKELLYQLEQRLDMRIFENRRVVQILWNMVDINSETRSCKEMLDEDWILLSETYSFVPVEWRENAVQRSSSEVKDADEQKKGRIISRAPMKNETDTLNQIAILLKRLGRGEETIRLYEWALQSFRQSRVWKQHRFLLYGLLLGNAAAEKCSVTDSDRALRYSLRCGKLSFLGKDYLTLACALEDEPSNRELCRRMIQRAYYLFELSYSAQKQSITQKYYADNYGGEIEEN